MCTLVNPTKEVVPLYIYRLSSVIDFSSEKTLFLLDIGTPGASREDTMRMMIGRLELTTLSYRPRALAIELNR